MQKRFAVLLQAFIIAASFITPATPSLGQSQAVGVFEGHNDIGQVIKPGRVRYDEKTQEYTVTGSGTNMWGDNDEYHMLWKRLKGDFILTARARFVGKGVEAHRKMGWIIRAGIESNAAHVNASVHGDGLTSLQFRRSTGGPTEEVKSTLQGADVIQLERKGGTYIMSVARFGEPFVTEQAQNPALGDDVMVGLYVCSHNKNVEETAVFSNVRVTIPASDRFVPYRDYIGSDLEILDVTSGLRRIIYHTPDSMQAPNWTRDGKALIFNRNGRLYRFDLATGAPTELNTDFATHNNNDHVLSFDGRVIGISNHSEADANKSIVYTVPIQGGKPRRVTAQGHSYLHGWSPDGKYLIYTAERNGDFDIYRIPAAGGEEINLTKSKGLDDGSEYSPDGKTIYFNSVRSGSMQLWRMKADGSDPQQVTNDEYNNWFAHVSPDGKWIAFLSFGKDVRPDDHPFYKRVYLRLMPIAGGQPQVIAYVYGGQGTINVPSWSPDSRRVAFVSNSDLK
ncbi:MAG: TolB family protein [Blastocatellia bacterium]